MKKVTEDAPAEEVPVLSTSSEKTINTQLLDSLDPNQLDTLLAELLMRKQSTQKPTQESTSSSIIQEREQQQEKEKEEELEQELELEQEEKEKEEGKEEELKKEQEQSQPVLSREEVNPPLPLPVNSCVIISEKFRILHYYTQTYHYEYSFLKKATIESVLKTFMSFEHPRATNLEDYCLVVKSNPTRILPLNKTIKECRLKEDTVVDSKIILIKYSNT